jgi:hypothetical protein
VASGQRHNLVGSPPTKKSRCPSDRRFSGPRSLSALWNCRESTVARQFLSSVLIILTELSRLLWYWSQLICNILCSNLNFILIFLQFLAIPGSAIAQAVSRRHSSAEVRVQLGGNPYRLSVGPNGTGSGFSPSTSFLFSCYYSTNVLYTLVFKGCITGPFVAVVARHSVSPRTTSRPSCSSILSRKKLCILINSQWRWASPYK